MAYIREIIIEKALVAECEKRGGLAYKLNVPGRVAVPDRLLLLPGGRAVFVECKAPGQSPRPAQQRELARLKQLGFEVYTLDTKDNAYIFEGEPAPRLEVPYIPDAFRLDSGYRNRKLKK